MLLRGKNSPRARVEQACHGCLRSHSRNHEQLQKTRNQELCFIAITYDSEHLTNVFSTSTRPEVSKLTPENTRNSQVAKLAQLSQD